jgi:FkbM family methyltransferase
MPVLSHLVAGQPAPLYRAEARILRRILAGRSLEQLTRNRLLAKAVRFPIADEFFELKFPSGGGAWFDAASAPFLYWAGFQTFEPRVVPVFTELAAEARSFVDVGAAFGFYPLLASALNRDISITAIEANPHQADVLEKNVARNAVTVRIVRAALAEKAGVLQLALAGGESSIEPHRGDSNLPRVAVDALTFDDLIRDAPDLVKIDVEGAELRVLHGMSRTLSQRRTAILCEVKKSNLKNVVRFLCEHNYQALSLPERTPADPAAPSGEDFLLQPV